MKILVDLSDLLDSNTSNIEALMVLLRPFHCIVIQLTEHIYENFIAFSAQEHGWNAWLAAVVRLDVFKRYEPKFLHETEADEQIILRNFFCIVLGYHMLSVRGGWQQLEETVNFLLMHLEQVSICLICYTENNISCNFSSFNLLCRVA